MVITVVHLYPEHMNIYGDTGNVLTIKQRLIARGHTVNVVQVNEGDVIPDETDIIIAGGGQDTGQLKVAEDLMARKSQLLHMRDDGVVMLVVCGTYQLFGNRFVTVGGDIIPGIGLFDLETIGGEERLIGNVTATSDFGDLVGFENHSGQTELSSAEKPFAQVTKGDGNNSKSKDEGAISSNVFGTYMHGPILPKNPAFADELIKRILKRRGEAAELVALDDTNALKAAMIAKSRPR